MLRRCFISLGLRNELRSSQDVLEIRYRYAPHRPGTWCSPSNARTLHGVQQRLLVCDAGSWICLPNLRLQGVKRSVDMDLVNIMCSRISRVFFSNPYFPNLHQQPLLLLPSVMLLLLIYEGMLLSHFLHET